ncbi:MAG TPA: prepilin-type N-terminal cleavage/methylation domain-containing protein [Rhodoferax sp.]|jgi:MSHA pilin protein MshD|nr:prepilin-type N-terminal cleavage/methylation domain-containing protein [Rhodoferax sp.]HNV59017.1 prepilin-type N-terminal cleavage/methylation domain-containing protein [Rhodoferax sp.]HPW29783.1 prepilin-type N-terminal cleavage/methylation domain-containing protein [Rhodoferax sp.]
MNRHQSRGFTLIEVIIFIVVVGAGLAGILAVSTNVVKSSADPMVRKQSMALADSILEEILQKEYADPDGSSGETTRDTMDDVDDYNGKTKALFTDWPASLSAYSVTIVVEAPAALGGIMHKRVTVTVTGGTHSIAMTGYRSNS